MDEGIHTYKEGDFYFAENKNLSVCGIGNTLEEAMVDLRAHIAHFKRYYAKLQPDQIIGDAIRLKRAYEELSDG